MEILSPNQLTLEEHINRIQNCFNKLRKSIFETVISIKECKEELGDDVFQKDVSQLMGMSPSYLNKWISVGNSQFIMGNQQNVPHTFSPLYHITQLEKKYSELYGDEGAERLQRLVDRSEISIGSQQTDITDLIKKIDDRIKRKSKMIRENNVLNISGGTTDVPSKERSLTECLNEGYKFRSFVIDLPNNLISRWGNEGVFETDIGEEFPLYDLRTPSNSESVHCLLVISSKKIDVGIKILRSFGFKFRDVYVPNNQSKNLLRLSNEKVVLRGERGGGNTPPSDIIKSIEIEDLTDWVDEFLPSPKCCVFGQTNKEDWVCLTK
jgi:hypothetical protein